MKLKKTLLMVLGLTLLFSAFLSSAYADSSRVWESKQNMPSAVIAPGSTVLDGKIYSIGGYNGTTATNLLQVYDPQTNSWEMKKNLNTSRGYLSATAVNGKIYAFGGFNGSTVYSSVEEYNPVDDTWTAKASMPAIRGSTTAVSYNGKAYVFGGSNGTASSSYTYEYDPSSDTWTTKATMPTARHGASAVVYNDKIYVIGGYTFANNTYLNKVEVYDPNANTWSTLSQSMPTARVYAGVAVLDQKIYVFGGSVSNSANGYLNKVEILDPTKNTWSTGGDIPVSKEAFGYAVINGDFYEFGGFDGVSKLNSVNRYYVPSTPEPTTNGRAILTVYIDGGQIKEYDLSMDEVNAFIAWYDSKDAGVGPAKYAFVKTWNKGPFKARTEYVIFDKILTFDVDEYDPIQ